MKPWQVLSSDLSPVGLLVRSPYEEESLLEQACQHSARETYRDFSRQLFAKTVTIRADEGLLPAVLSSLSDLIATMADEIRGDRRDVARRTLSAVGRRLPRAIADVLLGTVREKIGDVAFSALEEGWHDAQAAAA